MTQVRGERRRDPARKERILDAAAELVAKRGYHGVGLTDIGAAAGIVGSGVYRHFPSKAAVLVALFDRVIDTLSSGAVDVVESAGSNDEALDRLVAGHVAFAIHERRLLQVYHQEYRNLPEEDRGRLRRKQRLYLEEWVHVLSARRRELTDAEARTLVHTAVGAIHSVLFFTSGLAEEHTAALLTSSARSCLDTPTRNVPA